MKGREFLVVFIFQKKFTVVKRWRKKKVLSVQALRMKIFLR